MAVEITQFTDIFSPNRRDSMIPQQDYPGNLMVYSADDKLYREGMTLSDEFALSAIIVGSHYQRQLIFSPPEIL